MSNKRRALRLTALVLCLLVSICSCSKQQATPEATATPSADVAAQRQTSTSSPTKTTTKTVTPTQTRTATPTITSTPTLAQTAVTDTSAPAVNEWGIPNTANTPFDVTLTEEQINNNLAGLSVSDSDFEVSDPQATLGEDDVLVHISVYYEPANVRLGLNVRGLPIVYEGGLYIRVDDVTADDSVKGLTRLLVQTVVDAALKQYSGEHGIAIPFDQIVFESIDLASGTVHIVGHTR